MDIYDILMGGMPMRPSEGCDFWQDSGAIMCRTKEQGEALAELFIELLQGCTPTVTLLKDTGWYCVNI